MSRFLVFHPNISPHDRSIFKISAEFKAFLGADITPKDLKQQPKLIGTQHCSTAMFYHAHTKTSDVLSQEYFVSQCC